MNPSTKRCLLSTALIIVIGAVAAPTTLLGQLKDRQRPGIGNEIEGAVWQYTATRKPKDGGEKEEKIEGKIRIADNAIFEMPMRRLAAGRENRIGDIVTEKDEKQLVFNKYDKLDGRAFVKKVQGQKGTIWSGHFVDKNKDHWKFELRKSED